MARFASGLSVHPEAAVAVGEVVGAVIDALGPGPDLALLFVSGRMVDHLGDILRAVDALLCPGEMLAATAVGVLAGTEETETGDAVVLWAGQTGPVATVRLEALPGTPPIFVGLPDAIDDQGTIILLADPTTFPIEEFLSHLAEHRPGMVVVGGLASLGPGRNRLGHRETVHDSGAVAVVLPPGVAASVVSQGCRPIGQPWIVTAGDGQMLHELGGVPALDRVEQMIADLDPRDRRCASSGLHIGIVVDEGLTDFGPGDFLIRGVMGADRGRRSVAVGARIDVGRTVQFQVRDAESAHDDLVAVLRDGTGGPADVASMTARAAGALVFTCNGRGSRLFAEPNHDATAVGSVVPRGVAGMFCAGELGPVGGRNAVHGFTATVLLFP